MRNFKHTSRIGVGCVLLSLALVSGCASQGSGTGGGQSDAPLFKELPVEVQKAGVVTIGSSVEYPPFMFYGPDGKTETGFEIELARELEKHLGVKMQFQNASFDTLFTALRANRYDVVYGAVNDTAEREQAFDFVYYLQSSQGVVVASGNPKQIKTEDDLCGKTVGAVRGGVQGQYLEEKSKDCLGKGKEAITSRLFAGNADEQLALKQGNVEAMVENYPTAATFAKESGGALEMVPDLQLSKRFYGMVLRKDEGQLRDTLVKAWQASIDDGSYGRILDKYGFPQIAIKTAGVNAIASHASE